MRKIIYIFSILVMFCIDIGVVNAAYDKNQELLKKYIEQAENVKVKYILDEEYTDTNGNQVNGMFKLEITGLTNELTVRLFGAEEYYYYLEDDGVDGIITITGVESGIKKIGIYYQQYALVKTISVNIPKYNYYSERIECEGISGEELDVCGKWYEYELNESTFLYKVNKYKESQEKLEEEKEKNKFSIFFNNIVDFLLDYYIYIIIVIVSIALITLFIVIRKKRYSLE